MDDTDQLFALATVWTLIAVTIAIFIRNWWARVAFVALAVGIPFWELPYGYYNFQKLCREEGRLQVFEKIPPQKAACADYPFESIVYSLSKLGLSRIESRARNGEVFAYAVSADGKLAKSRATQPESTYCVTIKKNQDMPWRLVRDDYMITRVKPVFDSCGGVLSNLPREELIVAAKCNGTRRPVFC